MGFGRTEPCLVFALPTKVQQPEMEVVACADFLRVSYNLSTTDASRHWRVA